MITLRNLTIVLGICIFSQQFVSCTQFNNVCDIPQTLQNEVSNRYPGYGIVTTDLLNSYHRSMFIKDHDKACPGKLKIDFFGKGKSSLALLLINRSLTPPKVQLLIATQDAEKWDFLVLDDADASVVPVIWSEPEGEYEDIQENKIVAKYPVLLFVGYESWSILYYWTGSEVDKIWLSD